MNKISEVLEKLHEIATILSRPIAGRPLRAVLQEVATKLPGLLDADHSTIALLDEGRRFFTIEAEYPPMGIPFLGRRIFTRNRPLQIGLVERQEVVVANDLDCHPLCSESPAFKQVAEAIGIRSEMIVPMVADGATLGTISLATIGRTKCFSKDYVELCQTVASQVAGFVMTNKLRDEELAGVSTREEKVARKLFNDLNKVIQFKKASIQLIVNGQRILVGAFGFDKSNSRSWLLVPVEDDPIIREIVHTQKPKILPDTFAAKGWEKQEGTTDVNSWIGLPLVLQGQTIGIVTLDQALGEYWRNVSEQVLARLDDLIANAAQHIGDAYKLEIAQRQIQALDTIRKFAETVATKLDPQDLLKAIVWAISDGLNCTWCGIFLTEQQEGCDSLVCKEACGASSVAMSPGEMLPSLRSGQLLCPVRHAFQLGESVFIHDLKEEPAFDFTHALYRDARAVIVEHLKSANQVIGVVLAVHERPGRFTAAHKVLLRTLASEAASAIERNYGLELVHTIGNKILGAMEVKTVLEGVVSGAIKLTHNVSCVIYRSEEH